MNYKFKVNGQILTQEQHAVFDNFLIGISMKPYTKLIYRGESIENLKNKLNIEAGENFSEKLNYFIFNIGEKGRIYQREYFDKLNPRRQFSINETSQRFYKYIFDKINHVLITSADPEVLKFKDGNKIFREFFLNKKNKGLFVSKIETLKKTDQLEVRDYYLTFLHRVGRLGFYSNTFWLSTTTSKNVAKKFINKGDIMFVSWIVHESGKAEQMIKSAELPCFRISIFDYQREISLKGGLFPQKILGVIETKENIFNVNPKLFYYPQLIDYMINNGIPIDQTDFEEILARTNYRGYFTDDGIDLVDNIR